MELYTLTDDPKTKTVDPQEKTNEQKTILKEEYKKDFEDFAKKYGVDPSKPYTPVKSPTKQ